MKLRWYLLLGVLGILATWVGSHWQANPGYMDAEYYYSGGLRIATGYGFSEPFLWNYLDDPPGLPHPAFTYWMPLASFLAAAGMALGGEAAFALARIPFILVAGVVAALTAWLAFDLSGKKRVAVTAGLLAAVSGFYFPYLSITETFGLFMLEGALFLQVAAAMRRQARADQSARGHAILLALAIGLIAGLMHMTRADGLLWLALGLALVLYQKWTVGREKRLTLSEEVKDHSSGRSYPLVLALPAVLVGYLLIAAPWLARNWSNFGSLLPPGGGTALWLTRYDQLYAYPSTQVTAQAWLASGLGAILKVRWDALLANLKTFLGVQAEIFLLPLLIFGLLRYRSDFRVRVGALAWFLVLAVMTLVFPFAGARGGFFHSGAALQPLIWALSAAGIEPFIQWGVRKRRWAESTSWLVFPAELVALAIFFTAVVYHNLVIGPDAAQPVWGQAESVYRLADASLSKEGMDPADVVMVNNPPGYFVATGRSSIVIPDGDETTLLAVANRYRPAYLILEHNHPAGLNDLYQHPKDLSGLKYLRSDGDVHFFRFIYPETSLRSCIPGRNPR